MRKILGLDLGTNSIGWAVINAENDNDGNPILKNIEAAGSRIIPMDAAILGDFNKGNLKSQTAERTSYRSIRRLLERSHLRRERLHRVLRILGFLPDHYVGNLTRYGKFVSDTECKLPWKKLNSGGYEFIFQDSFNEMINEFKKVHPEFVENGKKIPYDWTIYYLRTKALTHKISKQELAWILLNFNQKRGYYQLREEEKEEKSNKLVEYYALKVIRVEDSGEKKGKDTWYNVYLENNMIYRCVSKTPLDWVGKIKEFIVTTDLNIDGSYKKDKEGNIKRSFRQPKEDDWNLLKIKTENDIKRSGYTIGEYIYHSLLNDPKQKIRGKLIRTVEREFYKEELENILKVQTLFHDELKNRQLYKKCIQELYSSNENYRGNILSQDFVYLFVNDIIFYQRPLKSKKSLISNCPYEEHTYIDKHTNERVPISVKCVAKSDPLYQELRLWQFIHNLKIYEKEAQVNGKLVVDLDVTSRFLHTEEDYVALFDWLSSRDKIKQNELLSYSGFKISKKEIAKYRWNYVEDKTYPCNETRGTILKFMKKANIAESIFNSKFERQLWHILYSVDDRNELERALHKFANKEKLSEEFIEVFSKFPPFPKAYGAYSAKAIKKLLPLMRMGKYWSVANINEDVYTRINKLINGEWDEDISVRVREKVSHLTEISQYRGLPLWLACYVVYGRHSEVKEVCKWHTPDDINTYLNHFKQYSLRNPIVEQVILETLRTVRDIWKQFGQIDEIHLELGREMKSPADKRAKITNQNLENERTNLRIKMLLMEFLNPEFEIENVRPYSLSQQEILRIYEEEVLQNNEKPEYIETILKQFNETDVTKQPSRADILRYKCWLEQKYCSPYTGEIIPLAKLFTPAYEIEHIIPQSRYFDDSFSNKVICEAEVNKLKRDMLGYEFIEKHHGEIVTLSWGRKVSILSVEAYENFVKEHYSSNSMLLKKKKLLMTDIPEQFIARQLNDTRYISKKIKSLLSNIVREDGEAEDISKNVIVCTGGITDRLKKDWGINDVWNKIILPRFIRLNEMKGNNEFTSFNQNGQLIPAIPLEYQRGLNKKRIDHRHHAMDAIVIACATRNIVNYLNNESASKNAKLKRVDLRNILCKKYHTDDKGNIAWILNKPWETFTQDTYNVLNSIIVSFKQNLRILNKTVNHYQHYENGKKVQYVQEKGVNLSIRKPLHKDTYYGEVNLRKIKCLPLNKAIHCIQNIVEKDLKNKILELVNREYDLTKIKKYFEENKDIWADINLSKIQVYYFASETKERYFASRKFVDTSFNEETIKNKVTDTGIQKILLRHLKNKNGNALLAFSPDGIDEMNTNIVALNDGKYHQPIYKVRVYEMGSKFAVGEKGNKSSKFVEAAKGTNLFYAIYENKIQNEDGTYDIKRTYLTIPLNDVIDRLKNHLPIAPIDENGLQPKFILSPNDLVYVPTQTEIRNRRIEEPLNRDRIYKMVSSNEFQSFFIKASVAMPIVNKYEYTTSNKMERAVTGEMIKEICIPIKINRLGTIINTVSFE